MYSGWIVKWRLNRKLTPEEKASVLPRQGLLGVKADDRGTLTAFNSTYAELVDRRFRLRGGFGALLAVAITIFFVGACVFVWIAVPNYSSDYFIGNVILTLAFLGGAALFWLVYIRKDFFTHTYYPVRFNRKTRQVHVFRDKRDGGILTVPWDTGFFHIGQGLRDKRLLDLRCHVLDGETVKDTFVTGMYYLQKEQVQQLWEFVRHYMDEDIDSLGKVEVWTSPAPTWKNCRIMVGVTFGGLSGLSAILWPLAAPIILTRWLVMKSCKLPQWPAEIEAACRIEPNDPHRLPEPEYIGQFAVEREMAKASH